jgi:hypothetical protein
MSRFAGDGVIEIAIASKPAPTKAWRARTVTCDIQRDVQKQ